MIAILTGPVHAGKTSFLEAAVRELKSDGFRIGGYLSLSIRDGTECSGYDLLDIVEGTVSPFIRKQGEVSWQAVGPFRFDPAGLETSARILRRDRNADLVVVDELGPLELNGKGVWPSVIELTRVPGRRILLVIRDSLLDSFLERFSTHRPEVIRFEDKALLDKVRALLTGTSPSSEAAGRSDDIYGALLKALEAGRPAALATVIDTEGSAPQVPGTSAVVSGTGLIMGTVGGGIVEAAVQKKAATCIESGSSAVLHFDLDASSVAEADLVCGGRMTVLLDGTPRSHMNAFRSAAIARTRRERGVLATCIHPSGGGVTLSRIWVDEAGIGMDLDGPFSAFTEPIKAAFRTGYATTVRTPAGKAASPAAEDTTLYIEPVHPRFHLIIAGAGHVGRALSHLGRLLDFDVTVIDDRSEFANSSNLPDAHRIIEGEFAATLERLVPDKDAFFVIVTRGHSKDAEALRAVIGAKAAYIGMMGSSRKVALMRDHFIRSGWCTPAQFDRVHTPIGIDIPSKTVQEIAVSIAAQLIQVRNTIRKEKAS